MTAEDRADYASLLAQYENLTFEEARLINAIDRAHYCGDRALSRLLTVKVFQVSARRHVAHVALLECQRKGARAAAA